MSVLAFVDDKKVLTFISFTKTRGQCLWLSLMWPATQKIEGKGDWPSRLLFWRQISQCLTSCPQQIAVPFHVWLFHLFLRCTIWRLTELFHAILCHLISCSTIWQKAKLFHASLRRLMLCCTIWHYSVLFEYWELAHFTFDWIIWFSSIPYCKWALDYSHFDLIV